MAGNTNIKIIVEGVYQLDYESAEALGIKFNRTVEDFTDLSKRFGEFSYSFQLPISKTNSEAFEWAGAKGRRGIFVGTQKTCRVYNNNKLLLDGVIELRAVKGGTYTCAFFSKFTQLIDVLGDKNLRDISDDVLGVWNDFTYEPDIISHLNANYKDSDETAYQFPLTYYSTPFTPYSVLNGAADDFKGANFGPAGIPYQNYYYLFGSDKQIGDDNNSWYFHQFPMGIYITRILSGILEDVGWSVSGSFFERPEIKKVLMMYTGDNDIYDRAINCPDDMLSQCTGITNNLVIKTFLPELSQTDFIKGLMNTFNLYFTLDTDNKIIKFETWTTMFADVYDPFDITDKVFRETANFSRIDNYDPTVAFEDYTNEPVDPESPLRVQGDNLVMVTNEDQPPVQDDYAPTDTPYLMNTFNRIGTTGEIKVPFGMPQVGRHYLRQDFNDSGTDKDGGDFQVWLPNITKQTPNNNDNKPFYKDQSDTSLFNTEDTIAFNGKPMLMFYYGQSECDLRKISDTDNERFYYLMISSTRTKFGIANPFTLVQGNALDDVNTYLGNSPNGKSRDTTEANYLKGLHYMLGTTGSTQSDIPEYSLTFGQDNTFGETLYTQFHKPKYDLYYNTELLEADMLMDDVSWIEMTINRPIKYDSELYQIISIDNYDVVNRTAKIKLIKK